MTDQGEVRTCPNGHDADPSAQFCGTCGTRLEDVVLDPVADTEASQPAHDDGSESVPGADASSRAGSDAEAPGKRRIGKRTLIAVGIALVLVLVAGLVTWRMVVPSNDDNYWESLNAQGLSGEYINQEIAVAQGKAFCEQVAAGATADAFWYQKTAVDFYCPEYAGAIKVVPTEEEQDQNYLADLREANLGGEFASDAAAVSSGRAVCTRLDEGGASQGPSIEVIAVKSYCPEFAGGFRELKTFKVTGTFTLYDEDYLCISGGLALSAGYDDIGSGTDVKWENPDGDRLATTTLGENTASGADSCEWTFTSELPEGEERYLLTIGRRGTQEYTEAELKVPDAVGVSLGSPF